MVVYSRGDVVLVGFVFSDESGEKLRPAVIISSTAYHRARQEVVVEAITSNIGRRLLGDSSIADWKIAGLLFPSQATGVIRTIKRAMIHQKLGSLSASDMEAIDRSLRGCLGL